MKTFKRLAIFMVGLFLFAACQKEFSMESGLSGTPATGSLQTDSGGCRAITPHGSYVRDSALTDSNYVTVEVFIATPGVYKIFTDTANGFSFKDSGYVAATGVQNFKLKGTGTPILTQATDFIVAFDSTFCTFSVEVQDSASNIILTPVTSGDYFPDFSFSNWKYEEASTGDTNRITVSPTDKTFAGNIYRSFVYSNSSTGPDTAYFRKGGGLYYQYSDLDEFFIYDTVKEKVDYIFLKDNVAVNSTWESPQVTSIFNTIEGKAKIKFTIAGKNVQTKIGTSIFDSVIQVQQEYMFAPALPGNVFQTLGSVDYFYAKNIGLIKVQTSAPISTSLNLSHWEIYY